MVKNLVRGQPSLGRIIDDKYTSFVITREAIMFATLPYLCIGRLKYQGCSLIKIRFEITKITGRIIKHYYLCKNHSTELPYVFDIFSKALHQPLHYVFKTFCCRKKVHFSIRRQTSPM